MAVTITETIKTGQECKFILPQTVDEQIVNDITLKLEDPKGAIARCEVSSGNGEFSLYKNGLRVGNTYGLRAELGYPTIVDLRTLTRNEEYLLNQSAGTIDDIPDNNWELYIVSLNDPKEQANFKFKVKLIPRDD